MDYKRPNVLFILADQMRGQAIGCIGDDQVITPNLDCLASESIMFTNAISTYPLCCPARAMLLTGKYPLTNGVITNGPPLPDDEVSIAQVLKEKGLAQVQ